MLINENTKLMARFHPRKNNRGLNIYNPYFQAADVNAVYLLFHNEDPKILIDGMRHLQIPCAIIAGSFETDPKVAELVDVLHPVSQRLGTIGNLFLKNNKITGVYQGGFGLYESIKRLTDYRDKKLVVLGAGNVVRALLTVMTITNHKPRELIIANRTVENAEKVANEFDFVDKVLPMQDMFETEAGDIFLNATKLGSPKLIDFEFPESFISNFDFIVDVTFVPLEPKLIETAKRLGKTNSPGHRMFLYQGMYTLTEGLGIDVNEEILSSKMLEDFKINWS